MRVIKKLLRPLYERLPATRRDRDMARRLEHLEFTQRRILAAIEAGRLDADRRYQDLCKRIPAASSTAGSPPGRAFVVMIASLADDRAGANAGKPLRTLAFRHPATAAAHSAAPAHSLARANAAELRRDGPSSGPAG